MSLVYFCIFSQCLLATKKILSQPFTKHNFKNRPFIVKIHVRITDVYQTPNILSHYSLVSVFNIYFRKLI